MSKKYVLYEKPVDDHDPRPFVIEQGTALDIFKALPMTAEEKLAAALEENKDRLRILHNFDQGKVLLQYDAHVLILDPASESDVDNADIQAQALRHKKPGPTAQAGPELLPLEPDRCQECNLRQSGDEFCSVFTDQPKTHCNLWDVVEDDLVPEPDDKWQAFIDRAPKTDIPIDHLIIEWIKTIREAL